jgi:hypothetical protein
VGKLAVHQAKLLYEKIGDALGAAHCIRGRAEIAVLRPDYPTAEADFNEAAAIWRPVSPCARMESGSDFQRSTPNNTIVLPANYRWLK